MKILLSLLLVSSTALANDAAILRCRSIAEATPRLACYDAMEVTAKVEIAPSKTVAAAPKSPPIVAAPSVAKTEVEKFGLVDKTVKKDELEVIESTIPGSFEGWAATTLFRLANGQVWRVADDSARPHYVENPKVKITRGAFGAFYMEIQGTKIAPRVKRIQ
jgi:hypothetical protein